jgi:GDP-L-fucose synthase
VNLGTDHEMPIRELVGHIAHATGFTGEIRWDATKPDGQPRRRVDTSRARDQFGFQATTGFEEGLRATVAWYLAHRHEAEARQN